MVIMLGFESEGLGSKLCHSARVDKVLHPSKVYKMRTRITGQSVGRAEPQIGKIINQRDQ